MSCLKLPIFIPCLWGVKAIHWCNKHLLSIYCGKVPDSHWRQSFSPNELTHNFRHLWHLLKPGKPETWNKAQTTKFANTQSFHLWHRRPKCLRFKRESKKHQVLEHTNSFCFTITPSSFTQTKWRYYKSPIKSASKIKQFVSKY